jgi:hypothetical protein
MDREDHQVRRSGIDRRSGEDRRKRYSLDYFSNGGVERRLQSADRRAGGPDRRRNWIRVSSWSSEPGESLHATPPQFSVHPF